MGTYIAYNCCITVLSDNHILKRRIFMQRLETTGPKDGWLLEWEGSPCPYVRGRDGPQIRDPGGRCG